MEDLNDITMQALDRYFKVLESVGYMSDSDTNKLILLQFLQEFLYEYSGYITEQDYTQTEAVLQCLAGSSCLVPYKQYKMTSIPVQNYIYTVPVRITQGVILRNLESDGILRLVNQ